MKSNQKGFTLIGGLLIVIALTMISGVSYYVYSVNKEDKQQETSSLSVQGEKSIESETVEPEKVDPYEGWKTYNNQGLSFRYPTDFYVDTSAGNFVEVSSFIPGKNGSPPKLDCPSQGYSIPKCEVKISILTTGTFEDDNGSTGKYFDYSPKDSDLKSIAEKITSTIKRQ